ncbi:MAG TPA: SMC family ATPase, partial [Gemmatimonadaceae bacterium]
GMSREEFFNTYFTGQKELGVMAAMGAADRGKFLSRVLGYERLRDAQELVRKRRSAIDAEVRGLRAGMPEPEAITRALAEAESRVATATSRIGAANAARGIARQTLDEIAPRWDAMQVQRDQLQAIVAELRVVDSERAARQRDVERIDRDCAAISIAREELGRLTTELAPLPALQVELKALDRACNEEARRKTLTESLRVLVEELARLNERRTKIETAPTLEIEATDELTRIRAELEHTQAQFEELQSEWVRDKQEAETKRKALVDQLLDVERQRHQIVDLGENGICPICARPLESHFRSVLEVLDAQIDSITADGKYFRARMEQLAAMPVAVAEADERRRALFEAVGKLERRLARVQAAVQELSTVSRDVESKEQRRIALAGELALIAVSYDATRHAAVRTLVERLTPLSDRATRLSTQIEREHALDEERVRVNVAFGQIETRARDLSTRREALAFSEQTYADLRETYESAAATFHSAELGAVSAEAEIAAANAALEVADRARGELARAESQLAGLSRDRRLHDELDRAFGDIRTDLNQEMRPELSDRASSYIRELTDGRYSELELDDQYNIIVLEDAIPKPVISGGEEDLANLVLRLAISEMIAERAGQAFSLLILDEVFGSLDETRRHNVVDLLRRLQDRFEQVILITHIESVREGLDRVVTVRYDEESGTSRVETETPAGGTSLELQVGAAD